MELLKVSISHAEHIKRLCSTDMTRVDGCNQGLYLSRIAKKHPDSLVIKPQKTDTWLLVKRRPLKHLRDTHRHSLFEKLNW